MSPDRVHLHLDGHLNYYDAEQRARLQLPLAHSLVLCELVTRLCRVAGEIAIAANGGRASLDAQVSPSDGVELFLPMGGG